MRKGGSCGPWSVVLVGIAAALGLTWGTGVVRLGAGLLLAGCVAIAVWAVFVGQRSSREVGAVIEQLRDRRRAG